MVKGDIERLKEYTGVLIRNRTVSAYDGCGSVTYGEPVGYGHLVINVGRVKLGPDCEGQIEALLHHFIHSFGKVSDNGPIET